jgi:hypothetical protein
MIIVSQDRETIVNFDNVVCLETNSDGSIYAMYHNDNSLLLAKYDTKERAKQVLEAFTNFYISNEQKEPMPTEKVIATIMIRDKSVFAMPKE